MVTGNAYDQRYVEVTWKAAFYNITSTRTYTSKLK